MSFTVIKSIAPRLTHYLGRNIEDFPVKNRKDLRNRKRATKMRAALRIAQLQSEQANLPRIAAYIKKTGILLSPIPINGALNGFF